MIRGESDNSVQVCERVRAVAREFDDNAWPLHLRVILTLSVLLLIGALIGAVLATPMWSYNGTRLLPSFQLAYGHRVLELHGHGPLYSTQYGPLTYLAYLPATLFKTPNAAVLAGSTMTVVWCLITIGWLHFGGGRWRNDFWTALLGFAAACYLVCYLEPLRYSCVNIHADGPGIALGGAACAVLQWETRHRWIALISSAAFAVMAALCKQPLAFLAIGLLAYLWLADGRKVAILYLKALLGAGVILTSLCVWAFGPNELYYNLISLTVRQSWGMSGAAAIVQPLRIFIRHTFPVLLVAAVALVAAATQSEWKLQGLRQLSANKKASTWMIAFVVGLALLPSSIAGIAKIGGDVNSLSFSAFFFTVGVTCMLADFGSSQMRRQPRQVARGCLLALTLLLTIVELPVALPAKFRSLKNAEQQVVYNYIKGDRHTTFFPWFPLSHLLAEGRFYHSSYGVVDHVLAGEMVSPEYFQAYAPTHMNSIAFGKDGARQILGVDLLSFWGPAYRCAIHVPALASWQVYGSSRSSCNVLAAATTGRSSATD
jgi:hypothetical protein